MRHLGHAQANPFGGNGMSFRKPGHFIFGSSSAQSVVFQDGRLFTMNGRRIPEDFPDKTVLQGYAIPADLMYLVHGGPMPPSAQVYFPEQKAAFVPGLEEFSPDEVRQAIHLLRHSRAAAPQHAPAELPGGFVPPPQEPQPLDLFGGAPTEPPAFLAAPAEKPAVRVKVGK